MSQGVSLTRTIPLHQNKSPALLKPLILPNKKKLLSNPKLGQEMDHACCRSAEKLIRNNDHRAGASKPCAKAPPNYFKLGTSNERCPRCQADFEALSEKPGSVQIYELKGY